MFFDHKDPCKLATPISSVIIRNGHSHIPARLRVAGYRRERYPSKVDSSRLKITHTVYRFRQAKWKLPIVSTPNGIPDFLMLIDSMTVTG